MKISEQWLREWVAPKLNTRELAHRLTMAGLEVGAIEPVLPTIRNVVVGEIRAVRPHPTRADLTQCQVAVGPKTVLGIVCGAPNAAVGLKVPVAPVGATAAGGRTMTSRTIQGAESQGMMCSAADLGLEDRSDGLMVLDRSAPVGTPLGKYLGLDDVTLEIDLTPNRGDCLSITGVAREVAAITGVKLRPVPVKRVAPRSRKRLRVSLRAGKACPSYAGRVIENIRAETITPTWLAERLRRSGIRTLHPVVDITNYVMLELGQPMHAFDLDRLHKEIIVRPARASEELSLLDGHTVQLTAGTTVIADAKRAVALAGIMGGSDTAVTGQTRNIFLESAYFAPAAVAGRARALGLQTESSQRFERGVDPTLQRVAVERATALLVKIVGGKPGPVIEAHASKVRTPPAIKLRHQRLCDVLGIEVSAREVEILLKRLNMRVTKTTGGWRVIPPAYRFDIGIEPDLIEEIARLWGYENIVAQLPEIAMAPAPTTETRIDVERLRSLLIDRDYQEVITYSFIDPKWQSAIDPQITPLPLANPISAEMAVMRTSLWPGLLQAIAYNQNRQQTRLRLIEIGRRFVPSADGTLAQDHVLAGAVVGATWAEQWGLPARVADFFDVKADIEALVALKGDGCNCRFVATEHPALQPGQSATVYFGADAVGTIGVLHPSIQSRLGVNGPVVLFELRLEPLLEAGLPRFLEISRFPAIRRDISIVVARNVSAAGITDCVRKVAGNLLVKLELFDEFRGEGIDSGDKSLALGLTLQDSSRTLKEDEVEQLIKRIISVVASEWGARLR